VIGLQASVPEPRPVYINHAFDHFLLDLSPKVFFSHTFNFFRVAVGSVAAAGSPDDEPAWLSSGLA
jgi:hypothetical protein